MQNRWIVFALVLSLEALPAFALELKNSEGNEPRLRMEIEVLPAPPHDFDQYVQELTAAARSDVDEAKSKRDEEIRKDKQLETLNPLVLFHW